MSGLVAVIAGGLSHERDVSLASGRNLVRELRAEGVDVAAYDFDRNLLNHLERDKVAVALPALHGQFGEDGEIQTLLELIGLPFVGTPASACRVAYDKGTSREILRRAGVRVPDSVGLSAQTFRDIGATALMEHVMDHLGDRIVVKPTRGGSALGVTGVDGLSELPSALVTSYAYYDEALIERFYPGSNVSVVVRDTAEGPQALTPIEIDYAKGHEFDFSARYTAEYVGLRPLERDETALQALRDTAVQVHGLLGMRDLSRTDFIVDEDGSYVVLETAITPGATETSVMPFACTASGTSLSEVLVELIQGALAR